MYPHIMITHPLLAGTPALLLDKPGEDEQCLIYARVQIGAEFPFLISRHDNKTARYAGVVEGWWWGFELDRQAALGSRVDRRLWLSWPERDFAMRKFMQRCASVRKRDYDGVKGQAAKRLQNSVYGKMGSRTDFDNLVLSREIPARRGTTCSAVTVFDRETRQPHVIDDLWSVHNDSSRWSMVHNGSYVTAWARAELLDLMTRLPYDRWLYCDTDSLLIRREDEPTYRDRMGNEYGQLKIDAVLDYREIRGPKAYRQKTTEGIEYKIKAMPGALHAQAWGGEPVLLNTSRSLGVLMRGRFREEGGRYIRSTKRTISDPAKSLNGRFLNGRWVAEHIAMPEQPMAQVLSGIYAQD